MPYVSHRTVELEVLASAIRHQARALIEHQGRLKEVLDAIERQDMSAPQVRENLGRLADRLTTIGSALRLRN
jgi:hypothetical protein